MDRVEGRREAVPTATLGQAPGVQHAGVPPQPHHVGQEARGAPAPGRSGPASSGGGPAPPPAHQAQLTAKARAMGEVAVARRPSSPASHHRRSSRASRPKATQVMTMPSEYTRLKTNVPGKTTNRRVARAAFSSPAKRRTSRPTADHGGEAGHPADGRAHAERGQAGEVMSPPDEKREEWEEGDGVAGHVAVDHGQVPWPSLLGGPQEPLGVPDTEIVAQSLVGEEVDDGQEDEQDRPAQHVDDQGPEQEPPAERRPPGGRFRLCRGRPTRSGGPTSPAGPAPSGDRSGGPARSGARRPSRCRPPPSQGRSAAPAPVLGGGGRLRRHRRTPPSTSVGPRPTTHIPPTPVVRSRSTSLLRTSGTRPDPPSAWPDPATTASTLERWSPVAARIARPHIRYQGHTVGLPTTIEHEGQAEQPYDLELVDVPQQPHHAGHHQQLTDRTGWRSPSCSGTPVCPTACTMEWKNAPRDTEGVDRIRSSVGTCRAVGPSHVQPSPAASVTPMTTTMGATTASRTTRQRSLVLVAARNWSTPMKMMAAAAGSLMVAARAHRVSPTANRPSGGQGDPRHQQPHHEGVVVTGGHEAEQGQRAQRTEPQGQAGVGAEAPGQRGGARP